MIQALMIFQWLSFRLVEQQNYHHVSLGKAEVSLFKAKRTCINILCGKCRSTSDRVIKYPEVEGAHKDYQVQLLALNRTPQESHPVPENIVQIFLELWQVWGHDHSLTAHCLTTSTHTSGYKHFGKQLELFCTTNIIQNMDQTGAVAEEQHHRNTPSLLLTCPHAPKFKSTQPKCGETAAFRSWD